MWYDWGMPASIHKKIRVNDLMQKGYVYELVEPAGKHFDPEFKPDLTPKQMLELGVFGGVYLRDCTKEFPKEWFVKAKLAPKDIHKRIASLNYFKKNASQSLQVWQQKGWIYKDDPRGWFQWYCRYYMGRRIPKEDMRQIKRWKAIKRHIIQLQNSCEAGDMMCRPRQRQAVLHWAYDSRRI